MVPRFRNGLEAHPIIGAGPAIDMFAADNVFFVDGDNGSDSYNGKRPHRATKTIQKAINLASAGAVIYIKPRKITALRTDPVPYVETLSIPNSKPGLSLIGIGTGLTMGGLPQLRVGTGAVPQITVNAPGCTIRNIHINGAGCTGSGIYLYEDSPGLTSMAFGTSIINCHFKNCKGTGAGATGGAIFQETAWNVRIEGNVFHVCRAGIVISGVKTDPQDLIIQNNVFYSNAKTEVDGDIIVVASNLQACAIIGNIFGTVDVPAYATTPTAARYILATGAEGILANNFFACIGTGVSAVTFGADGTGAKIPTTMRMAGNFAEDGDIVRT